MKNHIETILLSLTFVLVVFIAPTAIFLGTKPIDYVSERMELKYIVHKDNVDLLVDNRDSAVRKLSIALSLVERAEHALTEAKELERQAKAEIVRSVEYIELYQGI